MTHSKEVFNMNFKKQIQHKDDGWIVEEELPARANLTVIRTDDPNFGLTEDAIQERNEYIHWYMIQDFVTLMTIPKQEPDTDFFIGDYDVEDSEYSAFNTVDFQRQMQPFNKYAYAIKMKMEYVKDLAMMHSSISHEQGRENVYHKYLAFVEREFRERLHQLVDYYRQARYEERRHNLKQQIAETSRRIMECKRIWERYSPPEYWDH